MKLTINHTTTYIYDHPVDYALLQTRLTPKHSANQSTIDWSLEIEGGTQCLAYNDQHCNQVNLIQLQSGQDRLEVRVRGEVRTSDSAGIIENHQGYAPLWYFGHQTELTKPGRLLREFTRDVGSGGSEVETLHELSAAIRNQVAYKTGETYASTTAEDALAGGFGVCQDHAQIMIGAARMLGLPARYVSGYLLMDGQIDQDATHAWAEVHINGIGWVGFDVSNGISPDERYVRVATGLDYTEAAPISGMRLGTSQETMIVSLQVQQ
ncbi:MAG: transglutaminase family protein [Pseudomonadota bacterium]